MGILTKKVEVKVNSKNIKYYESLGYEIPKKIANERQRKRYKKDYVYDYGNILIIDINDLQKGSGVKIECLCDYCFANIIIMPYKQYIYQAKETGKIACKHCSSQKVKESCLLRYGIDSYAKTKECHERIKQTCLEKYGVEHATQLRETQDKRIKTTLEKYGVEYATQNKDVKEKTRNTNIERYGVANVSENSIIREKIAGTMYKNSTQKTSKQQIYLHNLYGGELNYPIKYYDVDICLLDEKITIEYDGSGHELNVRLGRITQEEFNQKEVVRNIVIKKEGYKQVRIISIKDLLPSDEVLLQMLSLAKEYFNKTSHTWISFDIDNSKIISAENKDVGGTFFDYGKLHKIKNMHG